MTDTFYWKALSIITLILLAMSFHLCYVAVKLTNEFKRITTPIYMEVQDGSKDNE